MTASARLVNVRSLALSAVILLVALWGLAYLTWPMAGDHGQLALVGDVIRAGGMPYRDAWTMKGPVALYTFAGIQLLFGRAMWGVRAFDLLALAVGTWAVFLGVRRFTTGRAGLWTAAGFVLWYASQGFQNTAQPDGWVAVLLSLGFLPLLGRPASPSVRLRLWTAALIGCCTLVKPLYGGFLLVPALDALTESPRQWRRLLAAAAWTSVGFLAPIAVAVGWFAAHGTLRHLIDLDILYASRIYMPEYHAGLVKGIQGLYHVFLSMNPPALAGAVGGAYFLWNRDRRSAIMLLTWIALAVFDLALAGQFYSPYHWLPGFPPLAILAGVGFTSLPQDIATGEVSSASSARFVPFTLTVAGLAMLVAANEPARAVTRWVAFSTGHRSSAEYFGAFIGGGPVVPIEDMGAGDYLRSRTGPSEMVGIWGTNALTLYLAGRRSPSRFNWTGPLVNGEGTAIRSAYRAEYLTELRRNPPIYFVVDRENDFHKDNNVWAHPAVFPELHDFLFAKYRHETTFGKLDLYRRRDE